MLAVRTRLEQDIHKKNYAEGCHGEQECPSAASLSQKIKKTIEQKGTN